MIVLLEILLFVAGLAGAFAAAFWLRRRAGVPLHLSSLFILSASAFIVQDGFLKILGAVGVGVATLYILAWYFKMGERTGEQKTHLSAVAPRGGLSRRRGTPHRPRTRRRLNP